MINKIYDAASGSIIVSANKGFSSMHS